VVDFSLSDQVYARARLEGVESVGLWLGAGVMVEYDLVEAKALLVSVDDHPCACLPLHFLCLAHSQSIYLCEGLLATFQKYTNSLGRIHKKLHNVRLCDN